MKSKILFILCLLFGLMMINSGLSKFTNHMPAMEMPEPATQLMGAMIASGWLFALVGIVEMIGGLLIIIPKTRALGAAMILPIMVGIILFNAFLAPANLIITLVMGAILAWVIYENRTKYAHLIEN